MTATRWTRVLWILLASAPGIPAQELKEESFDKLFSSVIPDAREQGWRKIPWHANFWDAVIEAQAKDKPVLLWAMNGHPMGGTAGNGVRYRRWVTPDGRECGPSSSLPAPRYSSRASPRRHGSSGARRLAGSPASRSGRLERQH